jgi:hypothetical protein
MDISIAGFRFPPIAKGFWLQERSAEKVHNYTRRVQGCDYFMSPAEESNQVYMTADGDGVKCQDYIVLKDETGSTQYQVEGIEYYGDSPSLWTALLIKR